MTGLPARVLIKITWYGVVFCDEKEEKDFFFVWKEEEKRHVAAVDAGGDVWRIGY